MDWTHLRLGFVQTELGVLQGSVFELTLFTLEATLEKNLDNFDFCVYADDKIIF